MTVELRSAWRALWASPLSTIAAILALSIGVGATTTVFGLVNAVMLRPLPYPDADRLVEVWGTVQRQTIERRGASYPDYFDWRDRTQSFDGMASWDGGSLIAYGSGEPVPVNFEVVDGPYLDLLGAQPLAGRLFGPSDHQVGAAPVVVIGETLWGERYNRSPDAIGRTLQLGTTGLTIVGVVPASFRGRSDQAVAWVPAVSTQSPNALAARGSRGFGIIARLKPGLSRSAAQADIDAVSAALAREYPSTNEARSAEVVGLNDELFGAIRPAVRLLFGIALAVMLIAAANVASLLLARGEERQHDMSVRRAIGSSDGRIVRLLLLESALIVAMGLGGGLLVAKWLGDLLLALSPVQLPSFAQPAMDWRTLAFLAALGAVTTVLFGLVPFRASMGGGLAQSLNDATAVSRGGSRGRTFRVVLTAQVAVAVVLLVTASLLGRSFRSLLNFDPGFDPQGVLSVRLQLPAATPAAEPSVSQPAGVSALALLDGIRGLPGVVNASLTTSVPLVNASAIFYAAENTPPVDATNRPRAYVHQISPGHFATLGLRIVDGRDFGSSDMQPAAASVIVSENVAKRFWPGQSAVGRRITRGNAGPNAEWLTIVGVVEEANFRGIPRNPTADPDLFIRLNELPTSFAVMLRTRGGDPTTLIAPLRDLVRRLEPRAALFDERTLGSLVDDELASARFLSWLTGSLAVLALTLAVIGIYGTFSYWVRRRRTEIGIRLALGAGRGRLVRLVVGQAVFVATIGVVTGLAMAAGMTRVLDAQLFGIERMDSLSFVATAFVMLCAATIASIVPAMRAMQVDPVRTLKR
jgi:putative ABC transport system permease protein